jgi:eukaryotic-like serine/threonine-protein kinase
MNSIEVPSVGDLLAERYRLEEHVGGANGNRQLWRGVDVLLHRSVAVVLRSPGGEEAASTMTAAVAASRTQVSSMVDVYDAVDEGRFAYVVREWVTGTSLQSVLEQEPLAPAHALELVASVADAVAALHGQDVTHGNLHPGAVLLSEDDRVMVTEPRNEPGHTPVGDVRALGATLYACLTGRWPGVVPANSELPAADTDESGRVIEAAAVVQGVPHALNRLVADLLDAAEAPPSAAELAAELRRLAETGGAGPLEMVAPSESATRPDAAPAGMRRMAVIAAAVAAVVFAGVLVGAVLLNGDDSPGQGEQAIGLTGDNGEASEDADDATSDVAVPTELALEPSQLRVVDPPDGSRSELAGVENLVDGNAATGWSSNTYYNRSNFGNLKPGMGILIDLGEEREVSSVRVQMTSAGATVGLLAGNEDPGDSSSGDQAIVDTFATIVEPIPDANSNLELQPGSETATRYIVVWITDLPSVPGGYKITISDINVFVR